VRQDKNKSWESFWEEDAAEPILEKKRSIRAREAADEEEEHDDDDDSDDGNESGSDKNDARTTAKRRATERTEQRFQPLAFALCVGTEKLVPSRV
jgi:hypothetical protein